MNIVIVIGVAVLLAVAVIGLLTHAVVSGAVVKPWTEKPSKGFPGATTGTDRFK